MISWRLLKAAIDAPRWVFEYELLTIAYIAANIGYENRVLEIGSWCGSSSLALLAGLTQNKGHLDCVDTWAGDDLAYRPGITGEMAEKSFMARIKPFVDIGQATVHKGDYREILPDLPKKSYALIFVDGPHEEAHSAPTIDLCLPLLTDGGTIVFHDAACGGWPGVQDMCRRVIETGQFGKARLVETMAIFHRGDNDKT